MRFLFVDRIVESQPGKFIRGLKHVTPDDAYLTYDEQGQLVFISSLIGESIGQLAAWNVMAQGDFSMRPVAGIVTSASLFRPVRVGETLLLEAWIDHLDDAAVQYHGVARVGDEVVFSIDHALGPLLPMTDFIDPALVKLQYQEIDRPGDWQSMCSQFQSLPLSWPSERRELQPSMQFDRILHCEPGQTLIAEKRVTRAASYFPDHFPRKPVLPMSVLLESKLNLAKEFFARASIAKVYRVNALKKIKMNDFIQPGDVVVTTMTLKRQSDEGIVLHCRTSLNDKRICSLDIELGLDGNECS